MDFKMVLGLEFDKLGSLIENIDIQTIIDLIEIFEEDLPIKVECDGKIFQPH